MEDLRGEAGDFPQEGLNSSKPDSAFLESTMDMSREKPLPTGPMLALSVMCISVALSETVLFPFAAFMVSSFHVTEDPTKLGYFAGFLASSFYGGSLLTSSIWGVLSDKFGRKPILVLGITANAFCALGFGFSQSFAMAITMRFINGFFNGVMLVSRTVISELCDASNQAKGFALIGVNWGIGFLIGPALGGFLSEPNKKYPKLFPPGSLFDKFPYAPPCILLFIVSAVGLTCVALFLPETKGRAKAAPKRVPSSDKSALDGTVVGAGKSVSERVADEGLSRSSSRRRGRTSLEDVVESELTQPLLSPQGSTLSAISRREAREEVKSSFPRDEGELLLSKLALPDTERGEVGEDEFEEDPGALRAFFMRDTVICAIIYSLMGLTTASQNEVFPLWGMTSEAFGGLGFGTDYIGLAQASAGIALIPFQLFIYSPLANRLGPLKTLKIMLLAMSVLTAFPVVLAFQDPKTRLLFCVLFMMVRGVSVICSFTSVIICLTNTITFPQHLGAINGLLQTTNMVFEAMGPTFGASLYAWSISSSHVFPFDYHLYWLLWGSLCAFMLFLASLLPSDIDERKFITEDA